jgi:hypothetical protein
MTDEIALSKAIASKPPKIEKLQMRRNAMRHGTSGRQSIVTAIEDTKELCQPV